ncbi:MAG TPA: ribosome maturation factor RimP [Nocardioides sp.]
MSSKQDAVVGAVETAIAGPLAELGMDLEAVELTPAGRRRVLRVAVDKDGGLDLDAVAAATKAVSAALDDADALGEQPYTLEVTSRGVDRPLTLPRHWRRNADRLVKVSLVEGGDVVGRITSSDETGAVVDTEKAGEEPTRVEYADVSRAVVQIEFNRRSAADEEA